MRNEAILVNKPPASYPLLRFLTSFPIAFFCGALATDIAYWQTEDIFWADSSDWLLAIGILMGALAALVGLITLIVGRNARAHRPMLPLILGSVVVLALALADNLVHSRDGWTSVVPLGLGLSLATVLAMLVTLMFAAAMHDRRWVRADLETTR